MNEYVEINKQLYGGENIFSKKKNPYECDTLLCSMSSECPLYKQGECLSAQRLGGKRCRFSKITTTRSAFPRASSFYTFEREVRANSLYNQLRLSNSHFGKIGGYYFIRCQYVRIWKNNENSSYLVTIPFDKPYSNYNSDTESKKWSCQTDLVFIPVEDLTKELLLKILEFKPIALFGGVIENYQEKYVPLIKIHIYQNCPEIAKMLELTKIDYVGKLGLLKTLKGSFDFEEKGVNFHFDGEFVTTKDIKSLGTWNDLKNIGSVEEIYCKVKPKNDYFITIKDNNWVTEQSVIKN